MEKTASCKAITEKKCDSDSDSDSDGDSDRRGGCMNLFSYFFRGIKIVSKKTEEEKASKRFEQKEKITHEISFQSVTRKTSNDEYNNHNVDSQHNTRSPGLVGRLMGLESMPTFAEQNQKLNQHVYRECNEEAVSGRKPLVRLRSSLHLKDVISRPKHLSRLKSSKGLNTRNPNPLKTFRLIEVATRILEPDKNRIKDTLTHSEASQLSRSKTTVVPPDSDEGCLMGKQFEQCVPHLVDMASLRSPEKNKVKPSVTIEDPLGSKAKDPTELNSSITKRPEGEEWRRFDTGQDDDSSSSLSRSANRQRNEDQKIQFLNNGSTDSQLKMNGNVMCEEEEADIKLYVDASSSASGDRPEEETSNENGEKQMALKWNALGAVLDRTLKELTCEAEEEMNETGETRRSTALILQDLISALTTEHVITKNTEFTFQTQAMNQEPPLADVQDSAKSIKNSDYGTVMNLTDRVSRVIIKMNEAGIGLKGEQLTHTQDVILNTEILFLESTGSVIGSSLIDQLEVLCSRNWKPSDYIRRFKEMEATDQLKPFFFHIVMEVLEYKYSIYGYSWRKLALNVNIESLFQEETERLMKVAGKSIDEIIEWEMINCSFGKWNNLEAEVYETGVEISSDLLMDLLEEFVMDLWISSS